MSNPQSVNHPVIGTFRTILVSGAERTGTTLLQRILCGAPQVVPIVGELPIINTIVDSVADARSNYDFFYADYLTSRDDLTAIAVAAVTNLVRGIRSKYPDRSVGVFKAPGFTPQLPIIREILPKAHFVVLRRNPLDTIVSMNRVGKRAKAADTVPFMANLSGDVKALAERFLSFYSPLMAVNFAALSPITYVKYERLVTRPRAEIARLSSRLNLTLSSTPDENDVMRSTYLQERPDGRHRPYWSELYRSEITAGRVNTYEGALTLAEQRLVLSLTADYRKWAGYK